MKESAIRAAHIAGEILKKYYVEGHLSIKTKSNPFDLVTQADIEADQAIVETLSAEFPTHTFWTEESGKHGEAEYMWLIDPLDGTTNFVHRYPHFAVAIALLHHNEPILAVTYNPLCDELFAAEKGKGATLNGNPISVSDTAEMSKSLLTVGFASARNHALERQLALFRRVVPLVRSMRSSGSAALNMTYIACGRLDGYWAIGLSPWDWVGGALMVTEAGGKISRIDGTPTGINSPDILVGNVAIHGALGEVIRHD